LNDGRAGVRGDGCPEIPVVSDCQVVRAVYTESSADRSVIYENQRDAYGDVIGKDAAPAVYYHHARGQRVEQMTNRRRIVYCNYYGDYEKA
jgi:hypothetical protein